MVNGSLGRTGSRIISTAGSRTRGPIIAVFFAALLLGVAAFFLWGRSRLATSAPPPAVAQAPARPASPISAVEAAEQDSAHKLSQAGEGTDERLRTQLAALSPRPEWKAWLAATRDLVESAAVIIANVCEGEDPRKRLQPLRPDGGFQAMALDSRSVESPESAHRFDVGAEVISSVDARALAPIWNALHPLIAVAYRPIGRPGVSLDEAASKALHRLESAPIPDAAPAVERAGRLWIYADPEIEKRGPIEKLLLRMGPANERKLQTKARELRTALALP